MTEVTFDRLVTFGDSLSDDGIIFDLTGQVLEVAVPPSSAGYDGRFSNGDVFATVTGELLDVEVSAFAVGAARAVGSLTLGELILGGSLVDLLVESPDQDILDFDIHLGGQVGRFLAEGPVAPGTAASFLIGLNDYNGFASVLGGDNPPEDPAEAGAALVEQVVSSTLASAGALAQAGVETLIFNTLPTATFFPVFGLIDPTAQALGTALIAGSNDALIAGSAQLAALGAEVKIVDFEALSLEILADQGTFGFVAPLSEPVLLSVGSNPIIVEGESGPDLFIPQNPAVADFGVEQVAFFDLLHPSANLHGVLGSFQAASLTHNVVLEETGLVFGSKDTDLVFSGAADDAVFTGRDQDIVFGGLGNDFIRGQRAEDIISGGSGDDRIGGGRGADVVADGAGDDKAWGGRGADVLIDGLGSDELRGGKGGDTFIFTESVLIGGDETLDDNLFLGGGGRDTLVLTLTEETRLAVEAQLETDVDAALASLGITADGIETITFADSLDELGDLEVAARLNEADLWGLV